MIRWIVWGAGPRVAPPGGGSARAAALALKAAMMPAVSGQMLSPEEVKAATGTEMLEPTLPQGTVPAAGWCSAAARMSHALAQALPAASAVAWPPIEWPAMPTPVAQSSV